MGLHVCSPVETFYETTKLSNWTVAYVDGVSLLKHYRNSWIKANTLPQKTKMIICLSIIQQVLLKV